MSQRWNTRAVGRAERWKSLTKRYLQCEPVTTRSLLVNLLVNLAGYLAAVDDLPNAAAAAREAIVIQSELEPEHSQVAHAIEQIALVYAMRGDHARAAVLEAYANAALLSHNFVSDVTASTTATQGRLIALLREELAPKELARLSVEGAALVPADAIALAFEDCER